MQFPPAHRVAFTIAEVAAATTLSRTSIWRLARDGKLEVRKIGKRVLIPADSLHKLLEGESA